MSDADEKIDSLRERVRNLERHLNDALAVSQLDKSLRRIDKTARALFVRACAESRPTHGEQTAQVARGCYRLAALLENARFDALQSLKKDGTV